MRPAVLILTLAVFSAACGASSLDRDPEVPPDVTSRPLVYAAIGASETVGVGTDDPLRQAWPVVLWHEAMPGAVFYNLGEPGVNAWEARYLQLPQARAVDPDVVTIWLNVNDLKDGVSVRTFRAELNAVVSRLRADGHTQVLVADTPVLSSLPAYLACSPDPPPLSDCTLDRHLPGPSVIDAKVDAYNEAIAKVVSETGAILVDLHALGDIALEHPEDVSSDGFHPSAQGAEAIAKAFADALPADLTTG